MTFTAPTTPGLDLRALLRAEGTDRVVALLQDYHPVEVAEALEPLPDRQRLDIYRLLPESAAAQVLASVDAEFRVAILTALDAAALARIIERLPVDTAVGILDDARKGKAAAILAAMSPQAAAQLQSLRGYPPQAAGHLMIRSFPRVAPSMTAREAIEQLRSSDRHLEMMTDLYVVDGENHLVGVVSLRELVIAPPDAPLKQLMQTRVVSVRPETKREDAANLISRYNFLALPVVDAENRIVGVLTVDDLIDVLIQEGTRDVLRLGAVEGGVTQGPYWAGRILTTVRQRANWLLLLFIAETFTGTVLRHFGGEIEKEVALSFYIPLLIGTGGNAGSQTVTTVVRGLAIGEIRPRDALRVLFREAGTGLLLGIFLGLVGFGWVSFRLGRPSIAAVVGLTAAAIVIWANSVGSLVPILANRLRIDPTVVSAPLITTVVDATGLVIYFLIAKALLGL
jgi:magnesium transporter